MSYTYLNYHVVSGTKNRQAIISPELLPRLCQYMGGIVRNLGGHSIEFNGMEDHMHMVLSIPPTIAVAKFIGDLKANSSGWIHDEFPNMRDFGWQDGYSIFTISPSVLPSVVKYVQGQQEHHKKMSFREELIWLYKNHGITFDEKHIE
jgi:REP element-mobilizing transposase RayT